MTSGSPPVAALKVLKIFALPFNGRCEECGLEVEPLQIAYVEDLWVPEMRICKVWFIGRVIGGELTATASGAAAELIVDARLIHRADFGGKLVFPTVLNEQYWVDKSNGFATTRYLGSEK